MFSLIVDGNLSTKFLASTNPKPVISRTTLITPTFDAPWSFKITLTSVGPASTTSAAAATATGAAAVTPNFSSIAFTTSLISKIRS